MSHQQLFFDFASPYEPPPLPPASLDPAPPRPDAAPLDQELAERITRKVARKLAGDSCTNINELGSDDLRQIGRTAIFKARTNYKPERGALSTFMCMVAERAMRTKLRDARHRLAQDRDYCYQRRAIAPAR